jgi:hypothetical protein
MMPKRTITYETDGTPVVQFGRALTGIAFMGVVIVEAQDWEQIHASPEWLTGALLTRLGPDGSVKFRVRS